MSKLRVLNPQSRIRPGSSGPHEGRELAVWTSRNCVKFHGREDRRIAGETEFREVFALEMEADSLADIKSEFIQGGSLRDHGKVEALGHKLAFAFGDAHLDRSLHRWFTSDYSMYHDHARPRLRDFETSSALTKESAGSRAGRAATMTCPRVGRLLRGFQHRSEEHTSELQSL